MNKELLFEDVKFPLTWDTENYKMFIFDATGRMVADVNYSDIDATEEEHPFEKLIGGFKEIPDDPENKRYVFYQEDFYDKERDMLEIGSIRGWGRLQYKDNPEIRQDNIAEYILTVINN